MTQSKETGHDWNCVSVGMYDSLYRCSKCGAEHMESADDRDSWLVNEKDMCDKALSEAIEEDHF